MLEPPQRDGSNLCQQSHFDLKLRQMSRLMGKPTIENKGADQLRGHREADQRLCFLYTDSTYTSSSS